MERGKDNIPVYIFAGIGIFIIITIFITMFYIDNKKSSNFQDESVGASGKTALINFDQLNKDGENVDIIIKDTKYLQNYFYYALPQNNSIEYESGSLQKNDGSFTYKIKSNGDKYQVKISTTDKYSIELYEGKAKILSVTE